MSTRTQEVYSARHFGEEMKYIYWIPLCFASWHIKHTDGEKDRQAALTHKFVYLNLTFGEHIRDSQPPSLLRSFVLTSFSSVLLSFKHWRFNVRQCIYVKLNSDTPNADELMYLKRLWSTAWYINLLMNTHNMIGLVGKGCSSTRGNQEIRNPVLTARRPSGSPQPSSMSAGALWLLTKRADSISDRDAD